MKRISMTYGQVLFELGIKKESLQKAQDMLHENEELLSALENPTITKKEKEREKGRKTKWEIDEKACVQKTPARPEYTKHNQPLRQLSPG